MAGRRQSRWGVGVLLALLLADAAPAQAPGPMFPAERAWAHLQVQCAFGPRTPGSVAHQRGLEYIRQTLERSGGRVSLQPFRHQAPGLPRPVDLTNVIARFGPTRPGGFLLGAHWDSRPWAERDPDPARRAMPIPGANDGASGTAVLLALAELWRQTPPEVPVMLVFFDGEDLGREGFPEEYLAGSRYFAAHLPSPRPEVGLVLDMVASATMSLTLEESVRQRYPEWAGLIDQLAVQLGLTAYRNDWGPAVVDDHLPLNQAGIATLLLIDFRDPYWHTQADDPRHCSAASLDEVGRLMVALVHGGFVR